MATIVTDQFDGLGETRAVKEPCRVITTAPIVLSDLQVIDGVTLVEGDRVCVNAQADKRLNGIYAVSVGIWQRTADFNTTRDVTRGTGVYVSEGTERGLYFLREMPAVISIGITEIEFKVGENLQALEDATRAVVEATNVESMVFALARTVNPFVYEMNVAGYAAPGDGGHGKWVRFDGTPSTELQATPFLRQSQDGAWWEAVEPRTSKQVGAVGGATLDHLGVVALGDRVENDDWAIIQGMSDYSRIKKRIVTINDYHYLSQQLVVRDGAKIHGIGKENCGIRVAINPPFNSVWAYGENVELKDFQLEGQCLTDVLPGGGTGGQGLCLAVGHLVEEFDLPLTAGFEIDILISRTANIVGSTSIRRGGYGIFGNSRFGKVNVDLTDEQPVGWSILGLCHWGGHFNAGEDLFFSPIKSYHPSNLKLSHGGDIKNAKQAIDISSVYNVEIDGFRATNCGRLFLNLAGDFADIYAGDDQKPYIGKGIRVGPIVGHQMNGDESGINDCVLVTSRGTAKDLYYQRVADVTLTGPVFVKRTYPTTGSDRPYIKQIELDIEFEGITISGRVGAEYNTGVRAFGVRGHCDFGTVSVNGVSQFVYESEFSRGTKADVISSDGEIKLETGQGSLGRSDTQVATLSSGTGVKITGIIDSYTLKGAVPVGSRRIILNELLTQDVHAGDTIRVNGEVLSAAGLSDNGTNYIEVNRVTLAMADGDQVVIERRADFDVYLESEGGREGLNATTATVNVTGPGCLDTGENGILVRSNAVVNGYGKVCRTNGRLDAASNVLAAIDVGERGVFNHYGCLWGSSDNKNEFIYRVTSTGSGTSAIRGRINVFGGIGPASKLITSTSTENYSFFGYVNRDGIPTTP